MRLMTLVAFVLMVFGLCAVVYGGYVYEISIDDLDARSRAFIVVLLGAAMCVGGYFLDPWRRS